MSLKRAFLDAEHPGSPEEQRRRLIDMLERGKRSAKAGRVLTAEEMQRRIDRMLRERPQGRVGKKQAD